MSIRQASRRYLSFLRYTTLTLFVLLQGPTHANEMETQCRKVDDVGGYIACKTLYQELNARDKWLIIRYGQMLQDRGNTELALKVYADGKKRYRSSVIDTRHKILLTLQEERGLGQITTSPTNHSTQQTDPNSAKHRMNCRVYELADPNNVPIFCKDDYDGSKMAETLTEPTVTSVTDKDGVDSNTGESEPANSPAPDPTPTVAVEADSIDEENSEPNKDSNLQSENQEVIASESYSDIQSQLDELKAMLQTRIASSSPPPPAEQNTPNTDLTDSRPRHALVIGNANYEEGGKALISSINDANDVAETLKSLGFSVILKTDLASLFEFESALLAYQRKLSETPNSIGLVFYAGHAIQFDGMNYLIPTSAKIRGPQDVRAKSMSLSYIQDTLEYAGNELNLVVLDSCRDNPFRSLTRSENNGLTMTHPTADGFLVIYAAKPGSRALDSAGRNSPFTKHFVDTISSSQQPIEMMFKELARAVVDETQGQQTPWIEGQYLGKFVFSAPRQ